jgi:hypothetical protein
MKKLFIISGLLLTSCSPIVKVFSVKGDVVDVNDDTLCVWRTYFFDRKTDTLLYFKLDTLPCNTYQVTDF